MGISSRNRYTLQLFCYIYKVKTKLTILSLLCTVMVLICSLKPLDDSLERVIVVKPNTTVSSLAFNGGNFKYSSITLTVNNPIEFTKVELTMANQFKKLLPLKGEMTAKSNNRRFSLAGTDSIPVGITLYHKKVAKKTSVIVIFY